MTFWLFFHPHVYYWGKLYQKGANHQYTELCPLILQEVHNNLKTASQSNYQPQLPLHWFHPNPATGPLLPFVPLHLSPLLGFATPSPFLEQFCFPLTASIALQQTDDLILQLGHPPQRSRVLPRRGEAQPLRHQNGPCTEASPSDQPYPKCVNDINI